MDGEKKKAGTVTSEGIPSRKDRYAMAFHKQSKAAECRAKPTMQEKRPPNWSKVQCYGGWMWGHMKANYNKKTR